MKRLLAFNLSSPPDGQPGYWGAHDMPVDRDTWIAGPVAYIGTAVSVRRLNSELNLISGRCRQQLAPPRSKRDNTSPPAPASQ